MNQLESRFAQFLESLRFAGEIKEWKFEAIKLRLADNTFYSPDFFVVDKNDYVVIYETKGYWEDDARVKIKVAANTFPFEFIAVTEHPKRDGGGFKFEPI